MRFSFERSSRLPRIPFWPAAAATVWAGLAGAVIIIGKVLGVSASACWFRRLFGFPCPTCGGSRALLALLEGRLLAAIGWNPLVTALLCIAPAWILARLLLGRSPSLELRTREWRALPALIVLFVAIDWAYVLARGH